MCLYLSSTPPIPPMRESNLSKHGLRMNPGRNDKLKKMISVASIYSIIIQLWCLSLCKHIINLMKISLPSSRINNLQKLYALQRAQYTYPASTKKKKKHIPCSCFNSRQINKDLCHMPHIIPWHLILKRKKI